MEHMSICPEDCEIVEIEEEDLNPREHYIGFGHSKTEMKEDKDRRSPASPAGRISSLEDDLSQLFEIFNRKASAHGLAHQHQSGQGPSRKNPAKKPITASGSHSPRYGISERVNLKQALRGLCISQASEMAALKRSGKSGASSVEAGKIMTMYRNAVVEDTGSVISQEEGKSSLLEISLVPEEITVESFHKIPERRLELDLRASSPNRLADKAVTSRAPQNKRLLESKPELLPKDPASSPYRSSRDGGNSSMKTGQSAAPQSKRMLNSNEAVKHNLKPESLPRDPTSLPYRSSRDTGDSSIKAGQITLMQNSVIHKLNEAGNPTSLTDMPKRDRHSSLPASPAAKMSMVARNSLIDYDLFPASPEPGFRTSLPEFSQKEKDAPKSPNPHPNDSNSGLVLGKISLPRMEMIQASVGSGNRSSKADLLHIEEWPSVPSYPYDAASSSHDVNKGGPSTNKIIRRESMAKSAKSDDKSSTVKAGQIGSSTVPPSSSAKANKANKSTKNGSQVGKPVTKTRSFLRRKPKKNVATVENSKKTETEPTDHLLPGSHQIICPNCHHLLPDGLKEVKEDSSMAPFLSAEASIDISVSDSRKSGLTPDSSSKAKTVIETSISNSKSRDKGEFTQSSKSSPGECSSSTSISEESNLSRPSCCDRPHMSKDVRWGAIRCVRMQQGTLGLRHFNLLKKLGCGDIGTVYLAELISTNCLFAIKVMDNEFLSRRKKITRAQTEKEILRMLDHPFLPTLYCQFTSDNLSCLVMEYCPGGDLHVLRQRQPGRCFTEQAARFYVAEVLLALEYLHMLGVVYRDLKPENILVREDGHIMLSDFDLSLRCAVNPTLLVSSAVIETTQRLSGPCVDSGCVEPFCIQPSCRVSCFTPRRLPHAPSKSKSRNKLKSETADQLRPLLVAEPINARSNSFVGTHEYLAPEIIKGEGHGSAVDWWTFGIFLYELLYGKTPFKGVGNEETLANVVLQSLKFPDSPLVSLQARDLIVSLLVKEPENRLGSERGAADIKQHPFFEGLNWALIRCAVPPELPEPYNIAFKKPISSNEKKDKYLDYNGEQLEFEVF